MHQARRKHEWIIGERKQLFTSPGSWYSTDQNQFYHMRSGITWKLPGLFGHYYKLSPTQSFKLPFIQLSDRWSNRHFGMRATTFESNNQEDILSWVHKEAAAYVLHFITNFMQQFSFTYGCNQFWSFRCRSVSTTAQELHRGMWT